MGWKCDCATGGRHGKMRNRSKMWVLAITLCLAGCGHADPVAPTERAVRVARMDTVWVDSVGP